MTTDFIPFNRPYVTGRELVYQTEALHSSHLSGDGPFTKRCHRWIEEHTSCAKALLTHSCTSALDMAALLLDLKSGDEVILPSYTFVSTANAFVLRGAVPVFVDIREDTLNLDEALDRGRDHDADPRRRPGALCRRLLRNGFHCRNCEAPRPPRSSKTPPRGIMAGYKNRALGAIGDLGSFSFHETKNIIAGEGGSLLVRVKALAQRAEIIREKGTDIAADFSVARSTNTPGRMSARRFCQANSSRHSCGRSSKRRSASRASGWISGAASTSCWPRSKQSELLRRPIIPADCQHNGHIYYVLLAPRIDRQTCAASSSSDNGIPRGVSLCPAALLAGWNALRARAIGADR